MVAILILVDECILIAWTIFIETEGSEYFIMSHRSPLSLLVYWKVADNMMTWPSTLGRNLVLVTSMSRELAVKKKATIERHSWAIALDLRHYLHNSPSVWMGLLLAKMCRWRRFLCRTSVIYVTNRLNNVECIACHCGEGSEECNNNYYAMNFSGTEWPTEVDLAVIVVSPQLCHSYDLFIWQCCRTSNSSLWGMSK